MVETAPHAGARSKLPWLLVGALALVAGVVLRVRGLGEQVVIDDEWHAIHKVLRSPLADILTQFDYADYSIPIALYLRGLYDSVGVSEWSLRLPMLVAGCVLIGVAPLLARPYASLATRMVWSLLIAVAPLMVYFSRVERPYAITVLLCTLAAFASLRWWRDRAHGGRWAALYVAAVVFAAWLHVITLPFTLTPLLFFGVRAWQRGPADVRRLLKLGTVTAVLLVVCLAPPLWRDWSMLAAKAGQDSVGWHTAWRSALMLAGSGQPAVLVGALALGGLGARQLYRRDPELLAFVVAFVVCGTAAIVLARPSWIMHPPVLARYLAPALPPLLWLIAEGIACLARRPPQWLAAAAVAGLGAMLVALGPLPNQWQAPNQFTAHLRYQFDYDDAHNPYVYNAPTAAMPAVYRLLGAQPPGSLTLVELPWRLESHFNPQVWYQAVHRQHIRIGLVTPVCGTWDFGEYPATAEGLKLRHMVHLSEILAGRTYGADLLVVHQTPWRMATPIQFDWPHMPACLAKIRDALGDPAWNDGNTAVFALSDRGRRSLEKRG